jgi:hypothetical protein
MSEAAQNTVRDIYKSHPVTVFSKSYCPYCTQAKKLLSDNGAEAYVIELDQIGTFYPSSIFILVPCSIVNAS